MFKHPRFITFMRTERAFTLVELLIVISIIAVLTVIGLISYTNFLKNSRNSKRQSDLKFIQSALEDYYADQLFYPSSIDFTTPTVSLTSSTGNPTPPSPARTYINTLPIGPKGTAEYQYYAYKCHDATCASYDTCTSSDNTPTSKCIKYCLFAVIEGTAPPSDPGCASSGIGAVTYPASIDIGSYNYAVSRP